MLKDSLILKLHKLSKDDLSFEVHEGWIRVEMAGSKIADLRLSFEIRRDHFNWCWFTIEMFKYPEISVLWCKLFLEIKYILIICIHNLDKNDIYIKEVQKVVV